MEKLQKKDLFPCLANLLNMSFSKRKLFYLFFFFQLFFTSVFAQTSIRGNVKNSNGESLTGVTVKVKGTNQGTATNENGDFTLTVSNKKTVLEISFVGFQTQEIPVNGKSYINAILKATASSLDEVVVIGYGTQSRSKITSSISKLDTKVLANAAIGNVGSALQGTIPGLRVINTTGQPGSAPSILLRGGASITSPGSPLVVVDGIVRTLDDINASDIESIEVLKDAASTAIYGARANNGVILVTTKTGKAGKSEFTYKVKAGVNMKREPYTFLDGTESVYYMQLGLKNLNQSLQKGGRGRADFVEDGWRDIHHIDNTNRPQFQSLLDDNWLWMPNPYNDGADTIIFKDYSNKSHVWNDNAHTQDHYLGFSGGNDKAKLAGSLGYYGEDGTVIGTEYKRYSGRLNGSYKVKDNVEVLGGVTFSNSETPPLFAATSFLFNYQRKEYTFFNPWLPDGSPAPGLQAAYGNPLYWLSRMIRKNNERKTSFNLGVKWEILKDLFLKANMNFFYSDNTNEAFDKSNQSQIATVPNVTRAASASYATSIQQQHNITLDYKKMFNNHNVSILAGAEYFDVSSFSMSAAGKGAASDDIYTLNAATERTSISSSRSENKIKSLFGRLNYDYKNKYLFTSVIRYDGTSVLDDSWGAFPGFSAGWNIHEEDFFKNSGLSKVISSLKPRISYGINGNIAGIGNYEVQGGYGIQPSYNGGSSFLNTGIVNTNLHWEKSKMFEAGIDIGLANNRVTLSVDYFKRITSDLLTSLQLPDYTGFSSVRTNLGNLQNAGFEADVNANILRSNNGINWNVGFNVAYVKNKILKLPFNGNEKNRQGGQQVFDPKSGKVIWVGGYQEGEEFGDLYTYKQVRILKDWDDVNASVANRYDAIANLYGPQAWANLADKSGKMQIEPGDVLWADLDGNDTINSLDMVKMGNIYPKWTGGFSSSLSYKNLVFYARFDYAIGQTIYDQFSAWDYGQAQHGMNSTVRIKDMWTPENPNGQLARLYALDQIGKWNFWRGNSIMYHRGDYLCLRELTVSYVIPKSIISKIKLASVQVNLTGQNLMYFTGYGGTNPELGGTDYGRFPLPRTVIAGLNISF